ncbi:helix-turn-helix domain-containing protein [Aggregatibacter actinomycetemcomitans]|uniref:helix-turn-helix domain-containing protein n=1 Tax=Aggregatibacter actinomycetemcomitans TaxID=714 RepID=UPI001E518E9D|nr:helix-turn-helix domain-containing protein [Aggregatibacter actinomycetemcomitans]
MKEKKRPKDMHRADIRAELMKKGISLAQLGVKHGLAKTTLRNALDKPYPRGEKIISARQCTYRWQLHQCYSRWFIF